MSHGVLIKSSRFIKSLLTHIPQFMKTVSVPRKDRWNTERKVNPNISQARQRERTRFDFRIEMELIGARLRRLRMDKGYSLESTAKALKMPKRRLHKIEYGLYVHFGLSDLCKLSKHYDTSTVEILSVIPDGMFEDLVY